MNVFATQLSLEQTAARKCKRLLTVRHGLIPFPRQSDSITPLQISGMTANPLHGDWRELLQVGNSVWSASCSFYVDNRTTLHVLAVGFVEGPKLPEPEHVLATFIFGRWTDIESIKAFALAYAEACTP